VKRFIVVEGASIKRNPPKKQRSQNDEDIDPPLDWTKIAAQPPVVIVTTRGGVLIHERSSLFEER
jgi:hypothetical protein